MILNKTRYHHKRYRIIPGNMGNHGCPKHWPNHNYQIANGIDRGNGYQGYMSIECFFSYESSSFVPQEAIDNAILFLLDHGYAHWLKENNLIVEGKLSE